MNKTLSDIAIITNASVIGDNNKIIQSVAIDSRSLLLPNDVLFFAIKGKRHNGHHYILDLYKKGVRAFVIEEPNFNYQTCPNATFLKVDNTLEALQQLASNWRNQFNYPVIAITGSNGKTIVKEWLYHLLQQHFSIVRSPKSYNSQVGVPLSVMNMNANANLAIFEAGISLPNEMEQLQSIIQPNIGIFTHLGKAHIKNFKQDQQLLNEKLKLFKHCSQIAFCADEKLVASTIQQQFPTKTLLTWSRNKSATLQIIKEIQNNTTTHITYKYANATYQITIPFIDIASINNAVTCCLVAHRLQLSHNDIASTIAHLEPVAMRLEIKEGLNNCMIINDYYNSDLGALEIALDAMNRQQINQQKIVILSDIYQSGYENKQLYQAVSELLQQKKIDRLIAIGKQISSQSKLFNLPADFYATTNDFLAATERNSFSNATILIKGARNFHFERISNILQQKGHRTILEVNLTAMVHNLNYFRSLLNPNTKLTVMVKAFSYGSGSIEVARLLQYHRVDYLAVAIADEGVELRNAGITTPIMVMNPELNSFQVMIEYGLEPEIYNLDMLHSFEKALKKSGVEQYPIHIKLDTGMHRMGFMQNDLDALIKAISNNRSFHIRSLFSHLAAADEAIHDSFTLEQIQLFSDWCKKINTNFNYPIDRHILNSAGIARFPQAQFEMVRLGIGLYGIGGENQNKLANVSTLKTTISQIKTITPDQTVGYGRKGVLSKITRIGIIPIGYADGFNRRLGNGVGQVEVNGKSCKVIGNVCMDMSMIDLTNVDAQEGDSVIIFGKNYTVSQMADDLGTIPYEILTTISRRVKRIYLQE